VVSAAFLGCVCGHLHGRGKCHASGCYCYQFSRGPLVKSWDDARRRFVWRPDVSRGNTATVAPGYHLGSYGLQNPMVQEAIRLGAYWDITPEEPVIDDAFDRESQAIALDLGMVRRR